jgi:preprotein translocase subunit SecA
MFGGFAKTLFGSANDRYVRSLQKIVDKINGYEHTISAMTDEELRQQTILFRQRIEGGQSLDDLLPKLSRPSGKPPSARSGSAITTSR